MGETMPRAGLGSVSGAILYEIRETCTQWKVRHRVRFTFHRNGRAISNDTNFDSVENKDGKRLRFVTHTRGIGREVRIEGVATLVKEGGVGRVLLTRPGRRVLALKPGTTFPTLHTLDLLRRARAGQKIFWHKVFDGSDELKTFGVSTVVTAALGPDKRFSGQPLLHRPGWRVRISYFDPKAGKSRPDYAIVMDLKDNGVTASLSLHYSGFSLKGALRKLEALPVARC